MTMFTKLRLLLCVSLALGGPACASRGAVQMQADMAQQRSDREPQRLIELARSFRAAGDLTRSEQYLNAAIESGADERRVFPLLIQVCAEDGRYRSAASYAEDALKKYPAQPRLRYLLGTLYAALGDVARAKQTLEQVVVREPKMANAHYTLAVLLRDGFGDVAAADTHFRAYLKLDPTGRH